jgi:hypothetical protein
VFVQISGRKGLTRSKVLALGELLQIPCDMCRPYRGYLFDALRMKIFPERPQMQGQVVTTALGIAQYLQPFAKGSLTLAERKG